MLRPRLHRSLINSPSARPAPTPIIELTGSSPPASPTCSPVTFSLAKAFLRSLVRARMSGKRVRSHGSAARNTQPLQTSFAVGKLMGVVRGRNNDNNTEAYTPRQKLSSLNSRCQSRCISNTTGTRPFGHLDTSTGGGINNFTPRTRQVLESPGNHNNVLVIFKKLLYSLIG